MPDNSLVTARVLARIAASQHSITVHFPPQRVVPTGAAPATAPTSLLNPPAVSHAVVETPASESQAPVTMQCLWMDAGQWSDVKRNTSAMSDYGWVAGADAMARVASTDVTAANGFLGTDHVTHAGREYKVLSVTPIGSSFAAAATFNIWLKGAGKH